MNIQASNTLAVQWLKASAMPASRESQAWRWQVIIPLAMALTVLFAWAQLAPLSGAVVAHGQVQAEFGRRTVQHQEGGIVQALWVKPGQTVRRGDPLMQVVDLRSDANLAMLQRQLDAERLRAARAEAELALADRVEWPSEADPAIEARQLEQQLFNAHREALQAQLNAQRQRLAEAQSRERALRDQLAASQRSTVLAQDELAINQPLIVGGYVLKTRGMALERAVAELDSRASAIRSQMAEAREQAAAQLQAIAQARGAYQQRAADEQKEARARMREIEDRLRPGRDLADRQTVRAPIDGVVMALRVSTAGTAVGPREALLDIAPSSEGLVIDVPVDPHDIDHVQPGGAAQVRLAAFDARHTPLLDATLRSITPDAISDDANRRTAYLAQVEVAAAELARHPGLRLQAGMPAEVFITTPARGLFDYLLEPLSGFARRGMREP